MPESIEPAAVEATAVDPAIIENQVRHQNVVIGVTFSSKASNDHLASKLGQLKDREQDVSHHRNAPDTAVGAVSAATADLADALSSGAGNDVVRVALNHLHDVTRDKGAHLVHRRSGDKGGGPTAHLQDELNKAQNSLQQAEANLAKIAAAGQSAAGHASGVVNAGSGSQVANNVAGFFGDVAAAVDALGDLIGGPAGVALGALGTVIGTIGDVISSLFGDGDQVFTPDTPNDPGNNNDPGSPDDQDPPDTGDDDDTGPGTLGGEGDPGGGCFTGSTTVLMADGSRRPIGELVVGDVVLGRDELTGVTGSGEVRRVFVHHVGRTLTLRLDDGSDVETTSVHRFATARGDFVEAGSLRRGDELATRYGSLAVDKALDVTHAETVYNLTVERLHTYFVGDAELWVHNLKREETDEPGTDDGSDDD